MHVALISGEYVSETNFDGGLANYLYRLACSLKCHGNEVTLIVLSDHAEESEADGIRLVRIPLDMPSWAALVDFLTLRRFSKAIHLLRASWLLNRGLRARHRMNPLTVAQYPQLGGLSLFCPKEVPAVIRISSYTPLWRRKGGYDDESHFFIRQQEVLEWLAMRRVKAIFSPSHVMAEVVSAAIKRPVSVIENPYFQESAPWDHRLYEERLEGKTYLLFVGHLSVLKGVAVIAEILAPLLSSHPGLLFVFVGSDPETTCKAPMSERLKFMAGRDSERVICLGRLRHETLYPILSGSLGVVLPSLIDNLPNACIEAMGMSKVVVGTFGTSFDQLICDGQNGFLCRPGDSSHLLQTLERLLSMPAFARAEMEQRARERIEQLRPERVIPRLTSWYEAVVAGCSAMRE